MSFRVWKGDAPPTPRDSPQPPVGTLPPDLVAAGARRLRTLALVTAAAAAIFALIDVRFARFGPSPSSATLWLGAVLASIGLSLAVAWIAWREMLAPEALLDLGLVYEVVGALCLGITFHSVPLGAQTPRGWSAVAVWILVYPLVVPATRGKIILATLAAALMDPLSLLLNGAAGTPLPSGRAVLLLFFPTVTAAAVAIVISRIIYALNVEAGRDHDMGSYHLEELLGRGGMGEVWRASHRLLARSAAIKLIRPDAPGATGRESMKRFEREAKAAAALRSPHTVDIYDFGTTEDGSFYYVMELLEGYDLETLVREFGPLVPERTIWLLRQACHSLAEAHQGGLIHRDVKPANIYACRYGLDWDFVKLLDFGLVKSTGPTDPRERQLTAAGVVAGTPGYMSPEMGLGSADVDWRSDIYSLGSVGFWLLTGRTLFGGGTPMQIVMDHIQKPAEPPSRYAPGPVPAALDDVILACLSKDPQSRPQTMQELSDRLAAVPVESPWTEERARRWWLENGSRTREVAVASAARSLKEDSAKAALVG
jgi:eukaryotic-like serine/threonine-protein kinase